MKKIFSTILTAIILGTTLMSLPSAYASPKAAAAPAATAPAPTAPAATPAPAATATPAPSTLKPNKLELSSESQHQDFKNLKFDVNKILSLDPSEQHQKYLNENVQSPILSFALSMIDYATTIIGSLAIIVLIAGGFMLMIAQGDTTKIDEAKEVVKFAAIGLAITFLSYLIAIFIQSLFITAEAPIGGPAPASETATPAPSGD